MSKTPIISYDGFLSSDIEEYITKIRAQNFDWFVYLTQLNQFGEKFLAETNANTKFGSIASKELIALLLTARTLSNLQAAILMAERGMLVEARTLARSILENVFYISALYEKGDEFAQEMLAAQNLYTAKFSEIIFKGMYLNNEKAAELAKYLKTHKDSPKAHLQLKDVMKSGKQHDLYTFYCTLSNDAAHPSIGSLNRYLEDQKDGAAHIKKMPVMDVEETLVIISIGVVGVIGYALEITQNMDLFDSFQEYKNTFMELEQKSQPDSDSCINPILTGFSKTKQSD